jgi:hypothetical protein
MFQHVMGKGHFENVLPPPKYSCRGFPKNLGFQFVEHQGLIVSDHPPEEVKGRCGNKCPRVVTPDELATWLPYAGTSGVHRIENPESYYQNLEGDEYLIIDPGNLCPSWLMRSEILEAAAHGGYELTLKHEDPNIAHFASIVQWMCSLEEVYDAKSVRMIFWFDSVPDKVIGL